MTDLYHHEQQSKSTSTLPTHTSVLTEPTMPSYYPQTRHRPFISRHLADHDDDDSDSTYKEAFIVQVFQHWKLKTLEHQQALHNAANIATPDKLAQISPTNPSAVPKETANSDNIPNDTSSSENKDETSNGSDPSKPIEPSIQKRAVPLVTTQTRRRTAFRKSLSTPPDCSNPNLLAPYAKTRLAPTASNSSSSSSSNTSTATTRKPTKPAPIFIAPKKSQPRSYAWLSISTDDVSQTKRKSITGDDQHPPPISPLWAPAPPTMPARVCAHPSGVSRDDDGTSSDENNYESLLIRNKRFFKKPSKTKEKHVLSVPSNLIIPTAICVTDPYGHSRVFDCSTDWMDDEVANSERIIENDYLAAVTFNPNHTYDYSSSSSSSSTIPISSSSSPSPNSLDKYGLHSIGEEEEEEENRDGLILSKELNRIQAYSRARQTNSSAEKKEPDQNSKHKLILPLERRWSDSCVSDDEDPIESPPSRLVKMASTTSITKQTPAKISKTKYLLMKLHLAPSPTKDDDMNMSTTSNSTSGSSRKRTVRRSSDKKRYQTR